MSNDKHILVNSIKDWLTLHNKLNSLQKEIKEIRNEKKKTRIKFNRCYGKQ